MRRNRPESFRLKPEATRIEEARVGSADPAPLRHFFRHMAHIQIVHRGGAIYDVTVEDEGSSTTHEVTVWPSDVARYLPGALPEELLQASFAFLLEREPKEAILRRFELPVIERYFPDYPAQIRRSLE